MVLLAGPGDSNLSIVVACIVVAAAAGMIADIAVDTEPVVGAGVEVRIVAARVLELLMLDVVEASEE